ncbi:MAG: hypothetical protein KDC58_06330 [Cyclobacteriaceae bacterium]|nr:hypothetical protein [Cyclobacteriaceae bacterium]
MTWVGIGIFIILVFLHYKFYNEGLPMLYWVSLLAKLAGVMVLSWMYVNFYNGGDTWHYFHGAVRFNQEALSSISNFFKLYVFNHYELVDNFEYVNQPRAALMLKLVGIVNIFTGNNYWVTGMYFSLISFSGVWVFAKWLKTHLKFGTIEMLLFLLWPSFVFWTSGVMKESVAISALLWAVFCYIRVVEEKRDWISIAFMGISLIFLFSIKYYYAAVLIPILATHFVVSKTPYVNQENWKWMLAWAVVLTGFLMLISTLHPNFYWNRFLEVIVNNHDTYVAKSDPVSIVHYYQLKPNWFSIALNAPKAFFAGLFLPLDFNGNWLYVLASVENWGMIILILFGLYTWNYKVQNKYKLYVWAAITFIIIQAVFLSLSTPNLGTLLRYKSAFQPFLLILVASLIQFRRQSINLPWLNALEAK